MDKAAPAPVEMVLTTGTGVVSLPAMVVRDGSSFANQPFYLTLFKQLIIFGFFTSEEGGTQVMRNVNIRAFTAIFPIIKKPRPG